jgi:hypothetical protein
VKKILFLYLFLIAFIDSRAQNYFLGTSGDGVEELYIMSVTSNRRTKSIVVFDRVKPAEGKLPDFRHNVLKVIDKKTSQKNLDKTGYYRRKIQYNCQTKVYRIMECTYYDMSGKEIVKEEFDEEETAWKKVPAGSLLDLEMKKVCQAAK